MRISLVLLCLLLCPSVVSAGDVANVTIGFGGDIREPEEVRTLIARQMLALEGSASKAGVAAINLQSVAYSIEPGYKVNGNLFIDVEPEEKTTEFVALLNKNGFSATANYYQPCVPAPTK